MTTPAQRLLWIDVLRTFAIAGVIFIHTFGGQLLTSGNRIWLVRLGLVIATTSVPVFFMISGALVLPKAKDQPISKYVLWKPIHIVILIVAWEAIYRLVNFLVNSTPTHISDLLQSVFTDRLDNAILWFLYHFVGIYIAAPFLSAMVSSTNTRRLALFVLISVGTASASALLRGLTGYYWPIPFDLASFGLWTGYFVCGYLIHDRARGIYMRTGPWAALAAAGVLFTMLIVKIPSQSNTAFLGYDDVGIVMTSIGFFGIFVATREKLAKWPGRRAFLAIGASSLGIYLIHRVVLIPLRNGEPYETTFGSSWSHAFACGLVALILSRVLIRTPFLRKLISL